LLHYGCKAILACDEGRVIDPLGKVGHVFCGFCVFVSDLLQVEQYVVGSLFCEFFGIAWEGGREGGGRGGESAFFGYLRHSAFELEEEGGEEVEF